MASPLPRHLRAATEHAAIHASLLDHVIDVRVDRANGVRLRGSGRHRAKYAPGLATELLRLAGTRDVGDPMAGTGTLAWETGIKAALNDIDLGMGRFLEPLKERGCEVTYTSADKISWQREACIFSPPYYPKADRRRPLAHNDKKRGPVVGFRDAYDADGPGFIGNPGGVDAILSYRRQMTRVYSHLRTVCGRMVVVTKNWTRLGTEMRLDLDTILMAQEAGWFCLERHGWQPPPSLWARFNAQRGGGVPVEDILVCERAEGR